LNNIRESGALFVRKVAKVIDPNIYKILPVDDPTQIPPIEWPKEVQVSAVPNWEKMVAMYKRRGKNKQQEEKSDDEETPAENEQDEVAASRDDGNEKNSHVEKELS
jgi:hypothetical protein